LSDNSTLAMKKISILLLLVSLLPTRCSGEIPSTRSHFQPKVTVGHFDADTNSNLNLLREAETSKVSVNDVGIIQVDLVLPTLGGEYDLRVDDEVMIGFDCSVKSCYFSGNQEVGCFHCEAYGESTSGRKGGFMTYDDKFQVARPTATIVVNGPHLSGIITDSGRDVKFEIRSDKKSSNEYSFKGVRLEDVKISASYKKPEEIEASIYPDPEPLPNRQMSATEQEMHNSGDILEVNSPRLSQSQSNENKRVLNDDDGSEVTLLYYFTKRAMCDWLEISYASCNYDSVALSELETMAAVITTYANQALSNSGVSLIFTTAKVYVDEDHDEGTSENSGDRLNFITGYTPAELLRDEYAADLVVDVFYLDYFGAAGIGWVPSLFPSRVYGYSSSGGMFSLVSIA